MDAAVVAGEAEEGGGEDCDRQAGTSKKRSKADSSAIEGVADANDRPPGLKSDAPEKKGFASTFFGNA